MKNGTGQDQSQIHDMQMKMSAITTDDIGVIEYSD